METTCSSSSLTSISNEATVVIQPIPSVSLSSNVPLCLGQSLLLTGASNTGGSYLWSGPNSFMSSLQNPTITNIAISNAGIYTLSVTQSSCTGSNSMAIAFTTPTIAVTNTGPYCIGSNVQLNTFTASAYTWTGPNSFLSTLQNPFILNSTLPMAGVYTLVANLGPCTASTTSSVSINTVVTPTVVNNSPVCAGANLVFSVSGGTLYSWSGPNSFTSSVANPTILNAPVNASGIYTLNAIDNNYCNSFVASSATVNPLPNISINTSSSTICTGLNATLTASGANSYSWNTSATTSVIVVNPSVTTTYTVIGMSANSCTNPATITQVVTVCSSIGEQERNHILSVHPNPGNGIFILSSNQKLNGKIKIINLLGELVHESLVQGSTFEINLHNSPSGLYLALIELNTGPVITLRLIKN